MNKHILNIVVAITILFTALYVRVSSASAALAATPAVSNLPSGLTTPEELETFLDGVFAARMKTDHAAGAVVAVVKDGELFFSKGYGYADLATQTPVDPAQTLFRIGSTSKLFVWTSIMQLVEQGKLDLDADINTYLDFKIPATYPEPITLKHLLTHTAGFEESLTGLFVSTEDQMPTLETYLKTHLPARVFPPGEVGAYSNYGVALAGYIVERVSRMPMYAYVEQQIFAPLGMTRATFRQPLPAELAPDMSTGYNYLDGAYQPGPFELVAGYPAGSVSATAEDMAKFMLAHLQNGTLGDARILSEATAQEMHSLLKVYDPRLSGGMAYGFFRETLNGQLILEHGGDTLLFHTGFYLLLDQNTGLFVSTNSMGGAATRDAVFKAFMEHYYPAPTVEPLPPADIASRAEMYTGEYIPTRSAFASNEKVFTLLGPSTQVTLNDEGYLVASSADETYQYVEIEPGLLQSREAPSHQLAFSTLSDGRTYVATDIPFSYVKARWYESQMLHLLLWGFSLLVLAIALFKWTSALLKALFKRESQPGLAHLARVSGVVYILLLIVFLVAFIGAVSDLDPVLQMPRFVLDLPSTLPFALTLPPFFAGIGVVLTVFTPIVWVKRFWNLRGRFGYTLVTLCAWIIVVELMFWNLL